MTTVIFDMDGVLVDAEFYWRRVGNTFLAQFVPGWSEADQRGILGMSIRQVFETLRSRYGLRLKVEEFISRYDDLVHRIYAEECNLVPGALGLLERSRDSGFLLALASSAPRAWIDIVVDRFGLRPYFNALVSGDEVPGRGKPLPDIFLLAASQLNQPPRLCVVIEDKEKGIAGARAAGMASIALRNEFNAAERFTDATLVLSSLDSLSVDLLRGLINGGSAVGESESGAGDAGDE